MRAPNELLAQVMREANVSNKALARLVRNVSLRHEQPVGCDHTSVSRWLAGMTPRGDTSRFIAEALSMKLGRRVAMADVGLAPVEAVDSDLGVEYGSEADGAISTLAKLWRADLDEARVIVSASANAGAWAEASLSWLVRSGRDALVERPAGLRVGVSDVAAVRGTTAAFASLDNQFGGGNARRALVQYLHSDLAPMLGGRFSEPIGRELYAAAAEVTLLLAWMSYDICSHGVAQRYFIQALRLAQAADDVLLAATILDAMSHQATFLGRSREAANLARAARTGTRGRSTPTLTAHFYAMEARALAVGGDGAGAQRALGEAVRVFERRQPGDDPEWISYFDDAELSAEFGHCFRDIGRAPDAVTYAQCALSGASARSDFFVTMVLASGHLGNGGKSVAIEEACRVAQTALDLGTQLKSGRCAEYMRQFRRQLAPFAKTAPVRALNEYAEQHALWRASLN